MKQSNPNEVFPAIWGSWSVVVTARNFLALQARTVYKALDCNLGYFKETCQEISTNTQYFRLAHASE